MKFIPTYYTVESVTSGHPDKICDQISDRILDECLKEDPFSRVAVETFGGHGLIVIGGEMTTKANIHPEKIAREMYAEIGHNGDIEVLVRIEKQSPEIAMGVDGGGAGDQGIMYGYATDETENYLPTGVVVAHALTSGLEDLRKAGTLPWLLPDGKAQVTISNGEVETVVVSTQHTENVTQEEICSALIKELIEPIVGDTSNIQIYVNPSGKFVQGGFDADTGLTGRKIMVDTYGGLISHGGGCFSGKDPTKVDRSAAYMARFVAKNLVSAGHGSECLVSLAYAIGREEPVMIEAINEKGESMSTLAKKKFDFRPDAIIDRLNLRRPIYQKTSVYGHFGRKNFPWEQILVPE